MTDKKAQQNVAASRKQAAEQTADAVEANSGIKAPSLAEVTKAQQAGVAEAIRESAKDTYRALTDGNLPGEVAARQWHGSDDIMQFEPLLDLAPEEFTARIAEDADAPIPEEKVYGLLGLERAGRNRTLYVQPMMKRLDLKPDELPNGGPPYTNDQRPITAL
jgi:hypothetical protein